MCIRDRYISTVPEVSETSTESGSGYAILSLLKYPKTSAELEARHIEAIALVRGNQPKQKVFLGNGSRRLELIESAEI